MKKWLVVHSLEAYSENPRMIGFVGKNRLDGTPAVDEKGNEIPASKKVSQIKPGDKIIYYCHGDSVIKGIFEVVQAADKKEPKWTESTFQFEIKPIIELDEPYDFKPLVGSLDLFKDLPNRQRGWGLKLHGIYNALILLTDNDYNTIEKALSTAAQESKRIEQENTFPEYRKHLHLQHQIAEVGIKSGFRVHVATNDKSKIKKNLKEILDDIPKFHNDNVLDGARRVDVLFFDGKRDVLTHAFEVEHTPIIYSGLLRLNDIAESYPIEKVKFFIISDESNRDRFNEQMARSSFTLLSKNNCQFINYQQVEEEWKQLRNKKEPLF